MASSFCPATWLGVMGWAQGPAPQGVYEAIFSRSPCQVREGAEKALNMGLTGEERSSVTASGLPRPSLPEESLSPFKAAFPQRLLPTSQPTRLQRVQVLSPSRAASSKGFPHSTHQWSCARRFLVVSKVGPYCLPISQERQLRPEEVGSAAADCCGFPGLLKAPGALLFWGPHQLPNVPSVSLCSR